MKIFFQIIILLVFIILVNSFWSTQVSAQNTKEERFEGEVINIVEEKQVLTQDKNTLYQKLKVKITQGNKSGQVVSTENGSSLSINNPVFKVGDKVVINVLDLPSGEKVYQITDYQRTTPLFVLLGIFFTLALLIGRKKGLYSLFGLVFSFFVIFKFVLPSLAQGDDPVFVVILASVCIIPVTFYLSHGINLKTHSAVLGTTLSLVIAGLLSQFFVESAHLSGFASEEAGFLQSTKDGLLNIKGLLMAGIIISMLGILDDVTVAQSSVVFELKKANLKLDTPLLFQKAMVVGKDHIASVVNTLVLVYTGAALPLLLLFVDNPRPLLEILNYEVVAEEVVRMLIASISLILAVPLATFISCIFADQQSIDK